MDYDQSDALIKAGYDAAQSQSGHAVRFSVDEATWQRISRRARRPPPPDRAGPQFVEVPASILEAPRPSKRIFRRTSTSPSTPRRSRNRSSTSRATAFTPASTTPSLTRTKSRACSSPPNRNPMRRRSCVRKSPRRLPVQQCPLQPRRPHHLPQRRQIRLRTPQRRHRRLRIWNSHRVLPPLPSRQQLVRRPSRHSPTATNSMRIPTAAALASIYRVKEGGGGADLGYIFGRSSQIRVGYVDRICPLFPPGRRRHRAHGLRARRLRPLPVPIAPHRRSRHSDHRTIRRLSAPSGSTPIRKIPSAATAPTLPAFPLIEGKLTQFVPLSDRTTSYFAGGGGTVTTPAKQYRTSRIFPRRHQPLRRLRHQRNPDQ